MPKRCVINQNGKKMNDTIIASLIGAVGIVIGVLGIIMISINYPIYKAILRSRKTKYSKDMQLE